MVTAAALPWKAACAHCHTRGLMLLRLLLAALVLAPIYAQTNRFEAARLSVLPLNPRTSFWLSRR
jgi:hypothetical protein